MRSGGKLVVVLFAGAILLTACLGPSVVVDCGPRFDVDDWCGSDQCEEGDKLAACVGSCQLHKAKVFSIPIAQFADSLPFEELEVELAAGGCGGEADADVTATLDGVPGIRAPIYDDFPLGPFVYRWDPFPIDPQRLELVYDNAGAFGCVSAFIAFANATCRGEQGIIGL